MENLHIAHGIIEIENHIVNTFGPGNNIPGLFFVA